MDNQDRVIEIIDNLIDLKENIVINTEKYDIVTETSYMEEIGDDIKDRSKLICKDIDEAIEKIEMIKKRIEIYEYMCSKFGR